MEFARIKVALSVTSQVGRYSPTTPRRNFHYGSRDFHKKENRTETCTDEYFVQNMRVRTNARTHTHAPTVTPVRATSVHLDRRTKTRGKTKGGRKIRCGGQCGHEGDTQTPASAKEVTPSVLCVECGAGASKSSAESRNGVVAGGEELHRILWNRCLQTPARGDRSDHPRRPSHRPAAWPPSLRRCLAHSPFPAGPLAQK